MRLLFLFLIFSIGCVEQEQYELRDPNLELLVKSQEDWLNDANLALFKVLFQAAQFDLRYGKSVPVKLNDIVKSLESAGFTKSQVNGSSFVKMSKSQKISFVSAVFTTVGKHRGPTSNLGNFNRLGWVGAISRFARATFLIASSQEVERVDTREVDRFVDAKLAKLNNPIRSMADDLKLVLGWTVAERINFERKFQIALLSRAEKHLANGDKEIKLDMRMIAVDTIKKHELSSRSKVAALQVVFKSQAQASKFVAQSKVGNKKKLGIAKLVHKEIQYLHFFYKAIVEIHEDELKNLPAAKSHLDTMSSDLKKILDSYDDIKKI